MSHDRLGLMHAHSHARIRELLVLSFASAREAQAPHVIARLALAQVIGAMSSGLRCQLVLFVASFASLGSSSIWHSVNVGEVNCPGGNGSTKIVMDFPPSASNDTFYVLTIFRTSQEAAELDFTVTDAAGKRIADEKVTLARLAADRRLQEVSGAWRGLCIAQGWSAFESPEMRPHRVPRIPEAPGDVWYRRRGRSATGAQRRMGGWPMFQLRLALAWEARSRRRHLCAPKDATRLRAGSISAQGGRMATRAAARGGSVSRRDGSLAVACGRAGVAKPAG